MREDDEVVEFEGVKCIRDSKLAILCVIDGKEVWIPQSHVHANSEVYEEGTDGKLVISEWIAKEKGLV